jgi:error-prone DNA polymerase
VTAGYAELAAASNFSFLRGASHPCDLVATALELGLAGIGIADRNSVAGVVRAHAALEEAREKALEELGQDVDFKLIVGARLAFADGTPDIVAYPANRAGWGRLCRLLTLGKLRAAKGECLLHLPDLLAEADDLLLLVMPPHRFAQLDALLRQLDEAAPGSVWLAATMHRAGDDRRRLARLELLAARSGVPLLATNDVLYHAPGQRPLQDVLTCIREKRTLDTAGRLLAANAERHLKAPAEMARLFGDAPQAVAETLRLLGRVTFSLGELRYEYPDEPVPPGKSPQDWLEELCRAKAAERYPGGVVPGKVKALLDEELALIRERGYARYFLTVHDLVRFAGGRGILNQGRGSAANSAVCYVLGITSVDPEQIDLLFSRFVSTERKEPPDIDVDFEHERREEVIQYVYGRYGRARAGIVATVIHYRPRSAVREVGKALGLSEDVTARLAGTVWGSWGSGLDGRKAAEAGLDAGNPTVRRLIDLSARLVGFPRHLSQHVGGFVLTRDRLDETVPIGNAAMADRTFIEWDKDDIDALGLMKVDVLALGMLTCIHKAFDLLRAAGVADHALATVPPEQADVYAMLQRGDSVGVFQVESRAQMNMLPRLKPKEFYDLVIQVAIVRPGPIQGDMVHPYLRRRAGREWVDFPKPAPEHGPPNEIAGVLGKTLGVPLFQEQAMRLAIVAAKFSPSEANQLRRAMATFRQVGTIHHFERKMVDGMVARGYDREFARRCFRQIEGFGSYGFPESHAASFARLVYVSAFIKCRYPAVFACALLNSQPMGFYAPAQIVRDAREHGVEVRPVDVNASGWDNSLERRPDGALALRLGFRQVDGFRKDWVQGIASGRAQGPFSSIEDLARSTGLPRRALRLLADADACRSVGLDRRQALWEARRTPHGSLPLFEAAGAGELGAEPDAALPAMPLAEHVVADYQTTRLSLKAHPMAFLRPLFRGEGVVSCAETATSKDGARVRTAGIVLVRQRPGKGNAIFITLEDETGIANVVLWARLFERHRRAVMAARLMLVEGQAQRSEEGVVHLMAASIHDRTGELHRLSDGHEARIALTRADEILHPPYPRASGHPRDVRLLPKSRDFH